jgi:hypothetical protein
MTGIYHPEQDAMLAMARENLAAYTEGEVADAMRAALGPEMYAESLERSRRLVAALEQPIIKLDDQGDKQDD